jgi:hypothetical protein
MNNYNYKHSSKFKTLLEKLRLINPLFDIEIIFPKNRWPENTVNEPSEKMKIMRHHHNISINALNNDIGLQAIIDRNSEADLWIHIIDDKKNIIGWSINKKLIIENQTANYFQITMFHKSIQGQGLYPLINELRIEIIKPDLLFVRTQNPQVYKYFSKLCQNNNFKISPTKEFTNIKMVKLLENLFENLDNQSVQRGLFNNAVSNNPLKFDNETEFIWSRMSIDKGDCLVIVGYRDK